jgi:hypothetical protein
MWIVSIALVLLDIAMVRAAVLKAAAWYAARSITTAAERIKFGFRVSFVDRVLLLVMVIAGLGTIIALEHRYRLLAEQLSLLRKGWKPIVMLAGIGLVGLAVQLFL